MRIQTAKRYNGRLNGIIAAAFTIMPVLAVVGVVNAATLTTSSVTPSNPRPSATGVSYDFQASGLTSATTIRCIKAQFTTESDGTGGVPTGLLTTGATVTTGTSDILASHASWTLDASSNGTLEYTNATGATPAASDANFVLGGITNGSTANDDFYYTLTTYENADCSTSPVDNSVVGFIYTDGQAVTISVDSALTFAVVGVAGTGSNTVNGTNITNGITTTSSTIPFGKLTSASNRVAAQDLQVSTNSGNGYSVYTRYTGAPAAGGSNTISDLATHTNTAPGAFSAAGTEAFGYTTEDATLGTGTAGRFAGNNWAAFTTTNAEVAYHGAATATQTTRVGFQAGIAALTEPGAYTTSVIYTATPVY